mgnify:CR=1 FL=1
MAPEGGSGSASFQALAQTRAQCPTRAWPGSDTHIMTEHLAQYLIELPHSALAAYRVPGLCNRGKGRPRTAQRQLGAFLRCATAQSTDALARACLRRGGHRVSPLLGVNSTLLSPGAIRRKK